MTGTRPGGIRGSSLCRPGEGRGPQPPAAVVLAKPSATRFQQYPPRRMGPGSALAEPVIGRAFARPVGSLVRDDVGKERALAFSRRGSPEFPHSLLLSPKRGRRGAGCALHPRSRVPYAQAKRCTRAYRAAVNTPTSPAQWLYGLYRALPGESAWLSPSPTRSLKASRELDACIAASGPHDFAVRLRPVVCRTEASIASPPQRTVTTADAPPRGWRRGTLIPIYRNCKRNIFDSGGLTRFLKKRTDLPVVLNLQQQKQLHARVCQGSRLCETRRAPRPAAPSTHQTRAR